ncbi:MAG TPA: hypothetical protein VMB66_06940, partial [Candidatus Acidoferrales bacterium]|nr:hypothetical protein [Candidatus Acidoferrales bacterium]
MPGERLDSWKEIASYLDRDVTTVQRWEKREAMPVHRHLHEKRGSVFALTAEIDDWRQRRKLLPDERQQDSPVETSAGRDLAASGAAPAARFRFVLTCATGIVVLLAIAYAGWIQAGHARQPRIKSLAVLPLHNLSGDPTQEYVADGMTEELIERLSRIHGLHVISRTSSMHFKDSNLPLAKIAKALGVDALVEGSIAREGHHVRVRAGLVRTVSDEYVWTGEYEEEYESILEVQDKLARSIVGEIEVNLTPEEGARLASAQRVDPVAHEQYLRGRYYFNQRTQDALKKSIASFQQSIARDSGYAPAYGGLAEAYAMLGFRTGLPPNEAFSQAKNAALKAIELDSGLAGPHAALAFIAETYEWDWAAAEREYKRSLDLNPGDADVHNWYAGYLTYVGRFDDAISEARQARDLDPLSLPINNALAGRLIAAGRYDEALKQALGTLQLDANFAPVHQTMGWIDLHNGKRDEAIREFQTALASSGANDTDLELDLGFAYAVSGKRESAYRMLETLEMRHAQGVAPPVSIAILCGALGRPNDAFVWLDKAYQERDPQLTYIKVGRRFDPLRNDPRFDQLLRRVGLSD